MDARTTYKSFAQEDVGPTANEILSAETDEGRLQLYKEAGLTHLVDGHDARTQARHAAKMYGEVTGNVTPIIRFFSDYSQLGVYRREIDDPEVLALLATANKSGLFNNITIYEHPDTHEAIALGNISDRYFPIVQWSPDGKLTDIASLTMVRPKVKLKAKWLPLIKRKGSRGMTLALIAAVAVASLVFDLVGMGPPALLLLIPIPITFTIGGLIGSSSWDRDPSGLLAATIGGTLPPLIAALIAVPFIYDSHTTYTRTIQVCDAYHPYGDPYWHVRTPQGKFRLAPGRYNGVTYLDSSGTAAQSLVGYDVKVMAHKHFSGMPVITRATALNRDPCGAA